LAEGRSAEEPRNTLSLIHVSEAPRAGARPPQITSFDRRELMAILAVYGRKVASGDWRDYAMDFLKDRAMFSIYARVSERPLFIIEKNPRLRNRQGQYLVTNQQGRILKRGHDLDQVLRVLEPKLALVD
jgi:hypothetical protein